MRQREREEFIGIMEGIPLDVARAFLRAGATLHRLAELECSSEAADRDRVMCPARWAKRDTGTWCLCRDYGAFDASKAGSLARGDHRGHGTIPRIAVQAARTEARAGKLAAKHGPQIIITGGDPRGAVLLIKLPSGRTNDWGGRGVVAG